MHWPWQRWRQRRAQADGRFAACFEAYRGDEWVALDLETTGLDPRVDEILSIAAVRGDAHRLRLRERLELTVRSRSDRIAGSSRHHQLRPVDVRDALPVGEALEQLLDFVGARPLVGYVTGFDVAMLDRPLQRLHGFRMPQRRIDIRDLYRRWLAARQPDRPGEGNLDAIATELGIPLFERHTALGDAVTTGLAYLRLR